MRARARSDRFDVTTAALALAVAHGSISVQSAVERLAHAPLPHRRDPPTLHVAPLIRARRAMR
jgi:hypothetical protein